VVIILIIGGKDPFLGMNAGFVGLVINSIITVTICLIENYLKKKANNKHKLNI
jgi:hypothetical protein